MKTASRAAGRRADQPSGALGASNRFRADVIAARRGWLQAAPLSATGYWPVAGPGLRASALLPIELCTLKLTASER